jgi:hypothetical protein
MDRTRIEHVTEKGEKRLRRYREVLRILGAADRDKTTLTPGCCTRTGGCGLAAPHLATHLHLMFLDSI